MEIMHTFQCKNCCKEVTTFASNKRSGFCALSCYWESKKGGSGYWTGKKRSDDDRKKISEGRKGLTAGEKHPRWKGGISSDNRIIRNSFDYKEWRRKVFARDGWCCVLCGYRSHKKINGRADIEADHIEPFSSYPDKRFDVTNGRTLCVPCHRKETFSFIYE
jgi:hypothetical protein